MRHAAAIIGFALVTGVAGAQTVAVRGLAYDSLHGKPLSGAFIGIAGTNLTAISDSVGRFTFAAVPSGTRRFVMQHDVLDAIGLSAAGAQASITDGKALVTVAVPSFAALWKTVCGPNPPARDTGFVFGSVSHGKSPLAKAVIRASWIDVLGDSAASMRTRQRALETDADSTGNYALCGIPTRANVNVRVTAAAGGTSTDLPPLASERVLRRDLAVQVAAAVQASAPTTTVFSGRVVKDLDGAPVADADVILPDAKVSGSTNARGEFRIANVPAGRHTVQIRKIGYTFTDQQIEFTAGTPVEQTLKVSNITTLDSVSVTARNAPPDDEMRKFEENRKIGLGKFITREELAKVPNMKGSLLVGQFPGIQLTYGPPGVAWLLGNNRGVKSMLSRGGVGAVSCTPIKQDDPRGGGTICPDFCYPHVYVDGVDISKTEVPNINRFVSDDLEGVEYYAGGARLPSEYNVLNARCGVLVLHTRRKGK
jgi:hypothetical protein